MHPHDVEREKRQLRAAIARSRRVIDRRLHAASGELSELTSWRGYVRRFPGWTLGLGLGAGLLLAVGLSRKGALPWLLKRGFRMAGGVARQQAWTELLAIWQAISKRA